jgi:ribosomal protein S18 acetylase RimI-like enzyme
MPVIEIVDVGDEARFGLIPPCADPSFDHRTCDYWEDADRGSKASRSSWLRAGSAGSGAASANGSANGSAAGSVGDSTGRSAAGSPVNPFAPPPRSESNPFLPAHGATSNPFTPTSAGPARNPFLDDLVDAPDENPFAPQRPARPTIASEAPRKLQLLGRGLGVFGTYAKLLLVDGEAAGYCQFGPLSAYPRALRLRQLYRQLPDAPLPAVITCIATTAQARRGGHALRLVEEVCGDLAGRGFAAVEAYPEARAAEDATPAARPGFWIRAGFRLAVDDERYPVVRREL